MRVSIGYKYALKTAPYRGLQFYAINCEQFSPHVTIIT